MGSIAGLPWTSFYDDRDPVADPLTSRNPVERSDPGDPPTLFESVHPDTGATAPVPVEDIRVDNLTNSPPGGLRAHNYWDNRVEVVPRLASIVREAAAGARSG